MPGLGGSFAAALTVSGDRLFFTAAVAGQREIWVTGGRTGLTQRVTAGANGRPAAYTDLTGTAAGLFFLFDDLAGRGIELWCTDGTTAGTRLVRDIGPGQMSGPLSGTLASVLGSSQLLFGASDLVHGLQLWRTDGTAAGTTQVSHIGGDRGAVTFAEFFAVGTCVFFAADDGVNGLEPWVYDQASSGLAFAVPYGTGCAGALGAPRIGAQGLPTIGNAAFALTVDRALPNAPAFLELSVASTNIAIGACRLLLALPLIDAAARFTDGAGVASAALPIPASSYLVGLNLFFQWAVVDASGSLFGVLALSNGMQVQIGG